MTEEESRKMFGQRLGQLREAAGLSQPQLASRASVPLGTLRNWEQGRRVPSVLAAGCIASVLGITVDRMIEGLVEVEASSTEPVSKPRGRPRKKKGGAS